MGTKPTTKNIVISKLGDVYNNATDKFRKTIDNYINASAIANIDIDVIVDIIHKMPEMIKLRKSFLDNTIAEIIALIDDLPNGAIEHGDDLYNAVMTKITPIDTSQIVVVIDDVEHRFDTAKSLLSKIHYDGKPLWKLHENLDSVNDFNNKSFSSPRYVGVINKKHGLFNGCFGPNSGEYVDGNGVVHKNYTGLIKMVAIGDKITYVG